MFDLTAVSAAFPRHLAYWICTILRGPPFALSFTSYCHVKGTCSYPFSAPAGLQVLEIAWALPIEVLTPVKFARACKGVWAVSRLGELRARVPASHGRMEEKRDGMRNRATHRLRLFSGSQ